MAFDESSPSSAVVEDGQAAAESAGLIYVSDEDLTICRRPAGKGFTYLRTDGTAVREPGTLKRIRSLAIPPAWTEVRICPTANAHIQAVGRDAKRRKQYRYHPRWREVRDETKYEHMLTFARALPLIRRRVAEDLRGEHLSREKVLAAVVALLETTLIRVGNAEYTEQNKSYGLTTLRNRHADVIGGELRFEFKGKSGKTWRLKLKDRRIARIVKACQSIPGQHLFQYVDDDGTRHPVTSSDVNAYLREITGTDVTAKDFRTWAGTVLAAMALSEAEAFDSEAKAKRCVKAAIETVAARLGNTPTICRKCYVHPELVACFFEGSLVAEVTTPAEEIDGLEREEAAVLALLERRLGNANKRTEKAAA